MKYYCYFVTSKEQCNYLAKKYHKDWLAKDNLYMEIPFYLYVEDWRVSWIEDNPDELPVMPVYPFKYYLELL